MKSFLEVSQRNKLGKKISSIRNVYENLLGETEGLSFRDFQFKAQ